MLAEVLSLLGGSEAGPGRFAKGVDGIMGTHSREGIVRSWVSAVDSASNDSASTCTSAVPCDDDGAAAVAAAAAVVMMLSSSARGVACGAILRHFSRARKRFTVCGPRADSGEKPSKASQAAAKSGKMFPFGRATGRLRRRTSLGPCAVLLDRGRWEPLYEYARAGGEKKGRTGPLDAHV